MNIYTLMMAAVLLIVPFLRRDERNRKAYIWLACFLMFVVMGLRDVYSLGIDSASSYIRIFRECGEAEWSELFRSNEENHNIASNVAMKLVHNYTGGNYQIFIILYSAFVMAVFARFIEKYSVSPAESFAYFWGLLCYIFLFDSLKQGIAMAFVTLAFDMILEKKPIRFILLVVIAYLFHAPALIFLPAYWVTKMKVGGGYLIFLALLLAFTFQFRDEIVELMLEFYGTEIMDTGRDFIATKTLIMIVIVVAAMVLRTPTREDRAYSILLQFMGIAIVLQTFTSYNNTFERLANYYFQFSVVFIPMVFQKGRLRSRILPPKLEVMAKNYGPLAFGAFGVWRFAHYIQSTSWAWLPFRFFFQ